MSRRTTDIKRNRSSGLADLLYWILEASPSGAFPYFRHSELGLEPTIRTAREAHEDRPGDVFPKHSAGPFDCQPVLSVESTLQPEMCLLNS